MNGRRSETDLISEKVAQGLLNQDRYVQICVLAQMLGEITGAGDEPTADFSYAETILRLAHDNSALRSRGT